MARPAALRLLAFTGALAYGALALGSAADRLAAQHPALGGWVPAPFANESLRADGRAQLAAGNTAAALRSARAAVSAAPLDPESTALLGAARAASRDRAGADRAFRVAGQLGWRVPYTQTYWLEQALAAGDYATAALRLDALLRRDPGLITQPALLDPFERNPAGQRALVARMALRPAWLDRYAGEAARLPAAALRQRATVLEQLAAANTPLGCEGIGPAITRLAALGEIAPALSLWQRHCPQRRSGALGDGAFADLQIDQAPSPFAWALTSHADVALALAASGMAGQRLMIDSSASVTRRIAAQLTPAAPGLYRLSWLAGPSGAGLRVAASCAAEPPAWQAGTWDGRARRWAADLALPADCPTHWITFGIAPGAGGTWLNQVWLEPLGR